MVSIPESAIVGMLVNEVCRKHGIAEPTYQKWKSKYRGTDSSDLMRVRDLESENRRLKRIYADFALESTGSGMPR